MQTLGLVLNPTKDTVPQIAREMAEWLRRRGVKVALSPAHARLAGMEQWGVEEEELVRQVDCLVALGGDGTLLAAAQLAVTGDKPLLGVNLGHLGFLTEVELPDLFPGLERLLAGDYRLEERMLLKGEVWREGERGGSFCALNDLVVSRGAFSRLLELRTYVEEDFVATYPADGLIVSTPTGSTAYSLAAGGPIIVPSLEVILLTPICPHTFYARPLVIEADRQVRIRVETERAEAMLTVDGQRGYPLRWGDEVRVTKAPRRLRLVKLGTRSFFQIMRQKLHLGENKGSGGLWAN
ncbi:MAG: NAD(+)/NADH kinase [Moorellales bacterium]